MSATEILVTNSGYHEDASALKRRSSGAQDPLHMKGFTPRSKRAGAIDAQTYWGLSHPPSNVEPTCAGQSSRCHGPSATAAS